MTYHLFKHARTPGELRDTILRHFRDRPIDTYIASELASAIYTKTWDEKKKMCATCMRTTINNHHDQTIVNNYVDMDPERLRILLDEAGLAGSFLVLLDEAIAALKRE